MTSSVWANSQRQSHSENAKFTTSAHLQVSHSTHPAHFAPRVRFWNSPTVHRLPAGHPATIWTRDAAALSARDVARAHRGRASSPWRARTSRAPRETAARRRIRRAVPNARVLPHAGEGEPGVTSARDGRARRRRRRPTRRRRGARGTRPSRRPSSRRLSRRPSRSPAAGCRSARGRAASRGSVSRQQEPFPTVHPVFEENKQMYDTANPYEERNKTCPVSTSHEPWIPLTCHVTHNHRSANAESDQVPPVRSL